MKIYLLLILILIPFFLYSYTIEETLSQIESLKKEIAHNEKVVEEKISNLKKSNPLFADQDPFESSAVYAERLKKGQPIIDSIHKQYLEDLWQKLGILRGRMFETENISITLGKYKPDAQIYPMKITHLDYQKEIFDVNVDIEREKAKLLYQNWDKVAKTGILTIDVGDKIGLAKIQLTEPISGFNYQYEFQPMITLNLDKETFEVHSATFSPNGRFIAVGFYNVTGKGNNIYIYDFENRRKYISGGNGNNKTNVYFSKDSNFIYAIWESGVLDPGGSIAYELNSGRYYNNVKRTDEAIFSESGKFICSIDEFTIKTLEI